MNRLMAAAIGAALVSATAQAQDTPVFGNPAKQIDVIGSVRADNRVIIIPTAQVKWMVYGKVSKTASPHAFQQNTRSARSTTEVIGSADPATIKALAATLYTDLVAQLRAKGWEVITADQLGADAPKWARLDLDPQTGLAEDSFKYDAERRYAIAAPGDMPVFTTIAGGKFLAPTNNVGLNKLARDRQALILVPTYVFDTAELDQSTRQGFNNVTASTSATASLLLGGSANVSAPRGFMTLSIKGPLPVAENIGELRKLERRGDSGFTSAMRFLGGLAKVNKSAFSLVADNAALSREAGRAGAAFNTEIVARLK
ncbi:hypothetical protein ACPVPU_03305 [Sphingomonas sp. CJ99]